MNVAVIGRTQMLYNSALKLSQRGYRIKAVVTAQASPEYSKKEEDFRKLAKKLNARYFFTTNLDKLEIRNILKGLDLGMSVNWVSMLRQKQIELFKIGILNAHMGDLPQYRGNACPNWAIINGEKEITISIHLVEPEKLDCGRIIIQEKMPLTDNTYIGDVYQWAEKIIPDLFLKALSLLKKNPDYTLKYADISSLAGFRCYPRLPEDSLIDWSKPAAEIRRLIRASSRPFSGAYSYINNKKVRFWRAKLLRDRERYLAMPGQIAEVKADSFVVITGEGKLKVTDYEPKGLVKSIRQRFGHNKNESF